jgi:predicted small lipoprotein YifL
MKKRQLTAILLIAALTLTLAACSGDNGPNTYNPAPDMTTDAGAQENRTAVPDTTTVPEEKSTAEEVTTILPEMEYKLLELFVSFDGEEQKSRKISFEIPVGWVELYYGAYADKNEAKEKSIGKIDIGSDGIKSAVRENVLNEIYTLTNLIRESGFDLEHNKPTIYSTQYSPFFCFSYIGENSKSYQFYVYSNNEYLRFQCYPSLGDLIEQETIFKNIAESIRFI